MTYPLSFRSLVVLTFTILSVAAVLVMVNFCGAQSAPAESVQQEGFSGRNRRLIVELSSPPLAVALHNGVQAADVSGKLDLSVSSAQEFLARLETEQAAFAQALSAQLPDATINSVIDEVGAEREAAYRILFNGFSITPGATSQEEAVRLLEALPDVKAVYPDAPYSPMLFTSVSSIRAPEAWILAGGGRDTAGQGIRIASIDSGVHSAAPMFSGEGYAYPPDVPPGGYGYTANNNGKIISSRAYFRSWDPPLEGEQFAWPGPHASSHGTHTASIAAGNWITATLPNFGVRAFSGVAPKAYIMSYKVNYGSANDLPFFFTTELLMALEDAVREGADIINNSWGGGPSGGGEFDVVDKALINAAKAGVFVSMSAGNSGPGVGTTDHPSSEYISVAAGRGVIVNELVSGLVTEFSSRGPGVGNVLKPDITAPGLFIYAQGYGSGSGEEQHLGFGAVSGTSMAAPHVSGAAAIVKQVHPEWSNRAIKSALMSTAQYMGIATGSGESPAQPLDMGAGWLNVAAALDPGVILDPPSLSFGLIPTNTTSVLSFRVSNVASVTETYTVTALHVGDEFTKSAPLRGFSIEPLSLTLPPGNSEWVTVTFDASAGTGYGDNQGYIILDGEWHEAHLAAWARVSHAEPFADVLLLDNDGSEARSEFFPDVSAVYQSALGELGYSFDVHAIDRLQKPPTTVPDAVRLMAYKAVILFTGTNGNASIPSFLVQSFTEPELDRLVEYVNNGGALIVMGASAARIMLADQTDDINVPFLYSDILGANWIQSSVSGRETPVQPVESSQQAPKAMGDMMIKVIEPEMDELDYRYRNGWPTHLEDLWFNGVPLFKYGGAGPKYEGTVSVFFRDQPSIELPGTTYAGRAIYTTFGLESVAHNADGGDSGSAIIASAHTVTPTLLLGKFLDWVWSEPAAPSVEISMPTTVTETYRFSAVVGATENRVGVVDGNSGRIDRVRWFFNDGRGISGPFGEESVVRAFVFCRPYTVTAEVTDWNKNVSIVRKAFEVTENCVEPRKIFFPIHAYD